MKALHRAWQLVGSTFVAPNTRLAVIGDGAGWTLDQSADELIQIIRGSGGIAQLTPSPWPRQPAFFLERNGAIRNIERWHRRGVSVCFPYFHGYPGEGEPVFDEIYERFQRCHSLVSRVQVTHPRMRDLLLETGIAPEKIFTIFIGVDARAFVAPTIEQRRAVRVRFAVPQSAVVVGSFQKDGAGWGDGLEPKLSKGPDILVRALGMLKTSVPELFVLLSGPSRGFVQRGLEAAGIPYAHTGLVGQADVPSLFHALDAYIVSSRQEGGPKAILEGMASGVPVISTRVGQAPALIRHGENGWLADVGDAEELAACTRLCFDEAWRSKALPAARSTAEANDFMAQTPQWLDFFNGVLRRR